MNIRSPAAGHPELAYPILVADIGGTNARFGIIGSAENEPEPLCVLPTDRYRGLAEAALAALGDDRRVPATVMVAFAGPIVDGPLRLTNCDWVIDPADVSRGLGAGGLVCLNDFEALALALPALGKAVLRPVGAVIADAPGNKVVLGPGTGLGVCGLVRAPGGWQPQASEAGHGAFGPAGAEERQLWEVLESEVGTVTAEHVLSGPGLLRLTRANAAIAGRPVPPLEQPVEVTEAARAGHPDAIAALDRFWIVLARFARNMALTFLARGGVYLAGGIVPQIAEELDGQAFRRNFEGTGSHVDLLSRIPVRIVSDPFPAFRGLSELARRPGGFVFDFAGRVRITAPPP